MFSGHRCYKIWQLCICGRNHQEKHIYSSVTWLQSATLLKLKTPSRGLHCLKKSQNTGFLWSLIFHIWTESYPHFPVFGQILWFCPDTKKYEYDLIHIRENADQRKPVFRQNVRTVFLCRNLVIVWHESTVLLGTLRNFTNLLLLHPYS